MYSPFEPTEVIAEKGFMVNMSRHSCVGVVLMIAVFFCEPAWAANGTTTTLSITPASPVAIGTVVTFTASVKSGGSPVSPGLVKFCNTAATYCEGSAVLGTASLTSTGTATKRLRLRPGTIGVTAVFQGTNTYAASISAVQNVTVTGSQSSSTSIAASGSTGNYTLTGTVYVSSYLSPSGTVSFLDSTNGNSNLGSAAITPISSYFTAAASPSAGSGAYGVVVADFNGDGIPDLAVADGGSNSVTILLGNGDGTFTAAASVSAGMGSNFLAVGDFNGDGKPDLAVANFESDTVTILLGNGNGAFTAAATLASPHPDWIAVGDFNGDGKLDLAVVDGNASGGITMFLGKGNGTFTAAGTAAAPSPGNLVAGDFNGDGKQDLAVINQSGSGVVTILLGKGDGTFTAAPATPPTGSFSFDLVAGDFNGDGKTDLAVINKANQTVAILLGKGDGTFTAAPSFTASNGGSGLVVGDFNGDGKQDLALANHWTNSVTLALGNGDGTFTVTPATYAAPNAGYIAIEDFNGDGNPDLAVVSGSVMTILLNHPSATATLSGVTVYGGGVHNVLASYGGNGNFPASQSSTIPLNGTLIPNVTTLSISPGTTETFGTVMQFTGSVAPYTFATYTAGGTVNFYDNGSTLVGSGSLSNGQGLLSLNNLSVGAHSISATYSGDFNFATSTSAAQAVTITPAIAPTVTQVASSLNPSIYGNTVTFSSVIDAGGVAPSGTVTFNDGAVVIGSGSISTASATNLLLYSQQLTTAPWAPYCGTGWTNVTTNTSDLAAPDGTSTATKIIIPSSTPCDGSVALGFLEYAPGGLVPGNTYTISVWLRGAAGGESAFIGINDSYATTVTLTTSWQRYTATFHSIASTGENNRGFQVRVLTTNSTIYAWGAQLEQASSAGPYVPTGASTATGFGGTASFSTTALTAGTHSITAVYGGGPGFAGSTSSTLLQVVNQAVLTITANNASKVYGTANPVLTPIYSGFVNGDTSAVLTGSPSLTATATAASPVGSYTITNAAGTLSAANYSFAFANGTLTITKATSSLSVSSTINPSTYGQSVTFTLTVAGSGSGVLPTGTVTLTKGGTTLLGTTSLSASGTATYTTSTLPVGVDTLQLNYSGDTNYF